MFFFSLFSRNSVSFCFTLKQSDCENTLFKLLYLPGEAGSSTLCSDMLLCPAVLFALKPILSIVLDLK